jgi:hypothetical protein
LIGSSEKLDGQDNHSHDQQERSRRTQKVSDDDSRQPVRSMRDVRVATATFRKIAMVQHVRLSAAMWRRLPRKGEPGIKIPDGFAGVPVKAATGRLGVAGRFLYKIFI